MQISALNIIIPENFRYSCLPNCAVCCAGWNIDVDEEAYKNFSKFDWEKISNFLNSPVFSKICNLLISQNNFEEIII